MSNLSADRLPDTRSQHETRSYSVQMKAAAVCYEGSMVFGTGGYAHGGTPLAGDTYLGQAEVSVDNTAGSNGSQTVQVRRGAAKWDNAGTNAVAQANVGQTAYASSDHEVATVGVVGIGTIDEIDSDGGIWVFDGESHQGASGYSDTVLAASPGPTLPEATGPVSTYVVETTGTVAGALPDGIYPGQIANIAQSIAASTPVGTLTGHFETLAGVAEGTLNLSTTVQFIGAFVWTGTKWRVAGALGSSVTLSA